MRIARGPVAPDADSQNGRSTPVPLCPPHRIENASADALEIPFVFGTLDMPGVSEFTGRGEAAEQLSARMQEAWRSFACGGAPRDDGVAWDAYRAMPEQYACIYP